MILETYIALYICAQGPNCPDKLIPSSKSWYSLETCRQEARLIAQGMYASSGNRYNFECRRIDFEPQDLTKKSQNDALYPHRYFRGPDNNKICTQDK